MRKISQEWLERKLKELDANGISDDISAGGGNIDELLIEREKQLDNKVHFRIQYYPGWTTPESWKISVYFANRMLQEFNRITTQFQLNQVMQGLKEKWDKKDPATIYPTEWLLTFPQYTLVCDFCLRPCYSGSTLIGFGKYEKHCCNDCDKLGKAACYREHLLKVLAEAKEYELQQAIQEEEKLIAECNNIRATSIELPKPSEQGQTEHWLRREGNLVVLYSIEHHRSIPGYQYEMDCYRRYVLARIPIDDPAVRELFEG